MRSLRCRTGSHHWQTTVVREEGDQKSLLQRCVRCGRERSRALSLAESAMPDTGDRTTPRPHSMDGWDAGG
ncbi:hypothetical protein CAE01nite_12840 [Cellulomonas aerilata]|uniref:Uncharacterized protein n=1 Tax=Cellulomonas aerilata TaxID=515326 RepID=A0A512DAQ8_9CELL|nr:hypothetical protein CAE01nite_12840 [Cellulomonas aerilata]